MKVRVISNNADIIKAITENIRSAEVETFKDIQGAADAKCDMLIVDGAVVPLKALPEQKVKVVYLTTDELEAQAGKIQGGEILFFDGRITSIIDDIQRILKSLTVFRNVLTFWGPQSHTGTTMTALTVMQHIPEQYRSLYLSLTDIPGIEYAGGVVENSISDIMQRLVSGVFDTTELTGACYSPSINKFYLAGLNSYVEMQPYKVDDIKALIGMAAAHFDYVVIDAGFGATLMSIAAMSVSANTYIVTDVTANAAERFAQLQKQVLDNVPEISQERFRLITNLIDRDSFISGHSARAYNVQSLGDIRAAELSLGIQAGYDSKTIFDIDRTSEYSRDMESVLGQIYITIGVTQGDGGKKAAKNWFSGLFGRK